VDAHHALEEGALVLLAATAAVAATPATVGVAAAAIGAPVFSPRRPEAAGPLLRCCAAMFRSSSRPVSGGRSQRQSSLAGTVGDGSHATVVLVAAAVEHDGLDAGGPGALGDQCTD